MPFELIDLSPREAALLSLEYLRASSRWFEEAADENAYGPEVAGLFAEAAAGARAAGQDLEGAIVDRFGQIEGSEPLRQHLKRPNWLVPAESAESRDTSTDVSEITAEEILETALSEQEEHYQFFVRQESETDDTWLRERFAGLASYARQLVVALEEEREVVLEREG